MELNLTTSQVNMVIDCLNEANEVDPNLRAIHAKQNTEQGPFPAIQEIIAVLEAATGEVQ